MTQSTTTYSLGDVVFVPFQFTDRAAAKNRPAVVISSDRFHASRQEVIIAGITSHAARSMVGESDIRDWRECGLPRPSIASGLIMTVRDYRISRKLGRLSVRDLQGLTVALRLSLDL